MTGPARPWPISNSAMLAAPNLSCRVTGASMRSRLPAPAAGRAWRSKNPAAAAFSAFSMLDDVDAVASLLLKGHIVAIKGLGGYHLACDATNAEAVTRLRQRKQRYTKAFALMARDLDVICRYAELSPAEEVAFTSSAAPIVLLEARRISQLPEAVALGLATLGFMLPSTPLHHLLVRRLDQPIVMTSGNRSDEPQIIDDDAARGELASIADFLLTHDRGIAVRLDNSVLRIVADQPRLLRRARGFVPAPIALPANLRAAPPLLALGGAASALRSRSTGHPCATKSRDFAKSSASIRSISPMKARSLPSCRVPSPRWRAPPWRRIRSARTVQSSAMSRTAPPAA